jgi:hypothetical protein
MFSSKDLFFTPAAGGYTVSKSLRFRSSASAYLSRTPGSAGTRTTWTYSCWVKRGALSNGNLFHAPNTTSGTAHTWCAFSSDSLNFYDYTGSAYNFQRTTTQVFRDPSAWYHFVFVVDSNNATAQNRARIYVNGIEITAWSTNTTGSSGFSTAWNNNVLQQISSQSGYFDGYMADVNFIGGSALTPTSFGAYDTNGIWQPIAYTGSYSGTNSFYLKFTTVGATSGSNTGYGQDFSGNGNYWTTNNFGTTSTATTYDSMLDSPTNATGDIGNYCVLNAVDKGACTISEGNLKFTGNATLNDLARASILPPSGKWYWEANADANCLIGVAPASDPVTNYPGQSSGSRGYFGTTGAWYQSNSVGGTWATYATTDTLGFALDVDAGTCAVYKNNALQGTWTSLTNVFPCIGRATGIASFNFGQRPFAYTAPSGFSPLCTQNLTTPTITNGASYMAAVTYTGVTGGATVTTTSSNSGNNPLGTTFQPDFVWMKCRNTARNHELADTPRGTPYASFSNLTNAEVSDTRVSAFNANGFSYGPNSNSSVTGDTYVAWQWLGGTAPTVDNTAGAGNVPTAGSVKINGSNSTSALAGSIAATRLSANTTAGFSVVTYAGSGSSSGTVGHGLGVAPSMIILKNRTLARSWPVMHTSLPSNGNVFLDLTQAYQTTYATGGIANPANSTTFGFTTTSTLEQVNASGSNYVAYCFAPVAGYSAFGSYTGNGSTDGTFVYTGFRPRYLLLKLSSTTGSWQVKDTSRDTYNAATTTLYPNLSNAEASDTAVDILSNGFKLRVSTGENASGATVIYAAFAENPFKISRAR